MVAADRNDASGGTLTCPECGREFKTPAALGAHRSRVHGVAGTSRSRPEARTPRASTAGRARSAAAAGTGTRSRSRTSTSARSEGPRRVDRDQLLRVLFPNGIPASAALLAAVGPWLDEAERLAAIG